MLTIRHTGIDLNALAEHIGSVPKTMIPYAAATALTRCAKQAQTQAVPDAMRSAFDGPTPYALNSLRIEPASKDRLSARVLVKNTADGGVKPENFLRPEVAGGARKHKRMENALRYQGLLTAGQYAMPGKGITLDAGGNVKGAEVRTILSALKGLRAVSNGRQGQKQQPKGRKLANDLFVGTPLGGGRPAGIWRREGLRLRPLFVFADRTPNYRQRLDFDGTVQQVALERFKPEFEKAVAGLKARGWT